MAHYAIYLPGVAGANPAHLERFGIASLGSDRQPEWSEVLQHGPDGGRGMMAVWRTGDASRDATLAVADKSWLCCDEREQLYWLGVQADSPIEPSDLLRSTPRQGVNVTLADGRSWGIPVADRLPHRYTHRGGALRRTVAPEYEAFCTAAAHHAMTFFQFIDRADELRAARPDLAADEIEIELTLSDTWRFCCDALAINYRVNDDIVSMLGLLDDAAMVRIIAAAIELPDILDVRSQKKTPKLRATIPVG